MTTIIARRRGPIVLLSLLVTLLMGCPSPDRTPVSQAITMGGQARAELWMSAREACSSSSAPIDVRVTVTPPAAPAETWSVRASDGRTVRSVARPNAKSDRFEVALSPLNDAGAHLPAGTYVLSVPITDGSSEALLDATFRIIRCEFY